MNLLVDIGNSRIKWAKYNFDEMTDPAVETYDPSSFLDVIDSRWSNLPMPQRLQVSNVAGQEIRQLLIGWVKKRWQIEPEFAHVSDHACGVTNAYIDFSQLGVDRWLGIIAAWQRFRHACCVVDCGTAITIDGVSDTGQHLGGMIVPGITMMQKALYQQTKGIPETLNFQGEPEFANNTQQGVASGCMMSVVTLIDRLVNDMDEKYDRLSCIITGGDAQRILSLLAADFELDPDLVLRGLVMVAGDRA